MMEVGTSCLIDVWSAPEDNWVLRITRLSCLYTELAVAEAEPTMSFADWMDVLDRLGCVRCNDLVLIVGLSL